MAKAPGSGGPLEPQEIIAQWLERDLSAEAAAGDLPPAFEVEHILEPMAEMITAGRNPILTGESGVGKTAAVYEFVRRATVGDATGQAWGPEQVRGKRFIQFSFARRAAGLKKNDEVRPEFQKLVDALIQAGKDIVPFFRDIHLAYNFDLEPLLKMLAVRFENPILGEADPLRLRWLLEYHPDLEQSFSTLTVEEPDLDKAAKILDQWAAEQARAHQTRFTEEALSEALYLSHRFLARARLPRKALEMLGQAAIGKRQVTDADVIARFSHAHRVPRWLVDPAVPLKLTDLEEKFRGRVLGQDEAVRVVVNMIGMIKAGLSDLRRPFGVFLFVGPTGVGKTHLAQLLAEHLFGSRDRMIRLNMADYPDEHNARTLFGNPEASSASDQRGVLTQRVMGHPFAVILLDEFEKAHEKVHDRFMQLMDEGSFINGAGETISCRSNIIIATSNTGAEVYRGVQFGFSGEADRDNLMQELDNRLEQKFRFEFLNRFDQIVHFQPLSRQDIRTIALRELEQLEKRAGFRQRALTLEIEESVLDWLAVHGYDSDYGARFLRRAIERHVTTAIADAIVREQPPRGSSIELCVRGNRVVARLAKQEEAAVSPLPRPELPLAVVGLRAGEADREELIGRTREVLDEATDLLDGLAARRQRYGELLEQMNGVGFWDDAEERREVLDEFRDLDVSIQVESRLARPLEQLREVMETEAADDGDPGVDPGALARKLESAAHALADWRARQAEEGPAAVWVVISNADPMRPAGKWLRDLTQMELNWCSRLGLTASIAAYEEQDGELSRVALEVQGPGAVAYLIPEAGLHRMHREDDHRPSDLRARVDLIPHSVAPREESWPNLTTLRAHKPLLGIEPTCKGRVELEHRGLSMEFVGVRPVTLGHFLHDLQRAWSQLATPDAPEPLDAEDFSVDSSEVARVYGENGAGARDPRTGATVPRLRDALRGNLDEFLDAWRKQHV